VDREHNLPNSELAPITLEIPLLEILQQNSGLKGTSEYETVFRIGSGNGEKEDANRKLTALLT